MATAYALVTPLRLGEDAKRVVRTLGIGRADLKVGRRDNLLFVPLSRPIDPPHPEMRCEVAEFSSSRPPKSYKEVVQVPDRIRPNLPTSFDVVGDIVLIKIPDDLRVYGPAIGIAILKVHKNIKGVFHDDGVQGPYRLRTLKSLAGSDATRTAHVEYGARFEVDVAKAYFSPRLANEHERVAALVGPDEVVADLTAGVGPFSVLIGRKRSGKKVYAVDLNPDAVALLKQNLSAHRLDAKVDAVHADARDWLATAPPIHRAIVNLPQGGEDIALAAAAKLAPGGTLHFYRMWNQADKDAKVEALRAALTASAGREARVVDVHVVHAYSPTDRLYAVDLRLA